MLGDSIVSLNNVVKILPGDGAIMFYNVGDANPLIIEVEDVEKAFRMIRARLKTVKIE